MRSVEVVRVLPARLSDARALLTPENVVRYEGGYEPRNVSESDGRIIVTTRPSGRLFPTRYVFEAGDDLRYRQESDDRPLVVAETLVELTALDGNTEIRLRSTVEPTVPLPLLGRYAAWRRRRALERLCDRLAGELGDGAETGD